MTQSFLPRIAHESLLGISLLSQEGHIRDTHPGGQFKFAAAAMQPLDVSEEDKLHKLRLLSVEEKPFKRITKRLLAQDSFLYNRLALPTPSEDGLNDGRQSVHDGLQKKLFDEQNQFRQEIILDFAYLESSIARIQFLHNSNTLERERYRADKVKIMATAQDVRDNTAQLRVKLDSARKVLAQRKIYDDLTEKITSNRLLRPRDEQALALQKLDEECEELERESESYKITWKERREQFERIIAEGEGMRRLIRDEKEEVERREGMDEDEEGEVGEDHGENTTPRHSSPGGQTPAADDGEGVKARDNPRNSSSLKRGDNERRSRPASPTSEHDSDVPMVEAAAKAENTSGSRKLDIASNESRAPAGLPTEDAMDTT
jgi:hypothetical protein